MLIFRLIQKWPERMAKTILGDKGYSTPKVRACIKQRGAKDVIAWKKNETHRPKRFPKSIYKKRNVIERLMGWLKEYRALATRFDKLATCFRGTIYLAMIYRYLDRLAPGNSVNTA